MLKKELLIETNSDLKLIYINGIKLILKNHIQYIRVPAKITIKPGVNSYIIESFSKDIYFFFNYLKLLKNFLQNTKKVYSKKIILRGLGFKISNNSIKELTIKLGFSHLINISIPEDLKVSIKKTSLFVSGLNLIKVGNFSKRLKDLRPINCYSGRGFIFKRELFKLKIFKKTK
jgi:ribosomal protein L6P/L9E